VESHPDGARGDFKDVTFQFGGGVTGEDMALFFGMAQPPRRLKKPRTIKRMIPIRGT